jgi:hypothetical protein
MTTCSGWSCPPLCRDGGTLVPLGPAPPSGTMVKNLSPPPLVVDILPVLPKDRVSPNGDDMFSPKKIITVTHARGCRTAHLLVPMEIVTTTSNHYNTRGDNTSSKLLLDDPLSTPTHQPHLTLPPHLPCPHPPAYPLSALPLGPIYWMGFWINTSMWWLLPTVTSPRLQVGARTLDRMFRIFRDTNLTPRVWNIR